MAEMTAAACAQHLGADHPVAGVRLRVDRFVGSRRVERGPAAAGVVFRLRFEQLGSAAGATVSAGLEREIVLAGERRFGALLAQNSVLLGRQFGTPLLLCFLNFRHVEQSRKETVRYVRTRSSHCSPHQSGCGIPLSRATSSSAATS